MTSFILGKFHPERSHRREACLCVLIEERIPQWQQSRHEKIVHKPVGQEGISRSYGITNNVSRILIRGLVFKLMHTTNLLEQVWFSPLCLHV